MLAPTLAWLKGRDYSVAIWGLALAPTLARQPYAAVTTEALAPQNVRLHPGEVLLCASQQEAKAHSHSTSPHKSHRPQHPPHRTCASDAAAVATGSKREKSSEAGAPSSLTTALSISSKGREGTRSCNTSRIL